MLNAGDRMVLAFSEPVSSHIHPQWLKWDIRNPSNCVDFPIQIRNAFPRHNGGKMRWLQDRHLVNWHSVVWHSTPTNFASWPDATKLVSFLGPCLIDSNVENFTYQSCFAVHSTTSYPSRPSSGERKLASDPSDHQVPLGSTDMKEYPYSPHHTSGSGSSQ